ncbi:hypothetical protein J2S74_000971 [Evansella vedderi]|uniref:Uncharacterized protein n=1 Tax=Evansella vedderi TaxID=38282 RepID=A0ABT9ZRV7_9BACI|nr:hypothetical protein [Evansella vedderi]
MTMVENAKPVELGIAPVVRFPLLTLETFAPIVRTVNFLVFFDRFLFNYLEGVRGGDSSDEPGLLELATSCLEECATKQCL